MASLTTSGDSDWCVSPRNVLPRRPASIGEGDRVNASMGAVEDQSTYKALTYGEIEADDAPEAPDA